MPDQPRTSGETARDKGGRNPWVLCGLFVYLLVGFALFPGAGRDDAHITYWPAYSLVELGSLSNYNGDAIEQSSSLLLVLILAALRFVTGAPMAWLGWLFGIACGALTIVLCGRLATYAREDRARLAPLALAVCSPFVYWSFSGMETGLQALLAIGWILAATRSFDCERRGPALVRVLPWTLALCAVRPEAMLVLACVLVAVTIFQRTSSAAARSSLWIALGLSAGAVFAVRLIWFDSWLPQPALAKSGRPLGETVSQGLQYLATHRVASFVALVGGLAGLLPLVLKRGEQSNALTLAGFLVMAQVGFVVFSGGDWMEGARFLAPVLPLGLVLLLNQFPGRWQTWLLLFVLAQTNMDFARHESRSLFAWQEPELVYAADEPRLAWCESRNLVHLRDEPTLVALEQIVATLPLDEKAIILTGQGGLVLFQLVRDHPGALRVVDRYGLLDRALTSSPAATKAGRSALGLRLGYPTLLRDWNTILSEANLPEPSIIFDVGIGVRDAARLRELGYDEVYSQTGEIVAGSKRQPAKQGIFVKRELAARLPELRLESFEFSQP